MKDAAKQYERRFGVVKDEEWEKWRDQLEYWTTHEDGQRNPDDDWCHSLSGMMLAFCNRQLCFEPTVSACLYLRLYLHLLVWVLCSRPRAFYDTLLYLIGGCARFDEADQFIAHPQTAYRKFTGVPTSFLRPVARLQVHEASIGVGTAAWRTVQVALHRAMP